MKRMFQVWCVALAALFAAGAHATPVETGNTTAELVADVAAHAPGEPFWVALKLTPRDGWHTYWRNPGDSGLPTTIEWTLPAGYTAGDVQWPAPHAVPYGPLMNFGYSEEHWLLVEITPGPEAVAGTTARLDARADWLVCEDICIPEGADLSLEIPVREASMRDMKHSSGFRDAHAAVPEAFEGEAAYRLEEGTMALRLASGQLPPDAELRFFPYSETLLRNPDPQTSVAGEGAIFLMTALANDAPDGAVAGVLTFDTGDGYRGVEISAAPGDFETPVFAAGPATNNALQAGDLSGIGLLAAAFYAFIGGLLLNLMPCVFPVLSLKALAVVKSADNSAREKRLEGLAYTAGVVLSFLAVAGALLMFRAAGDAVGWGFQLQSTWVVGVLALLLFAVGLNLSGYFEFGGRFVGLGQGLTDKGGTTGAFFTGVLATVVATPCTAPFMATALGYALSQPAAVSLAVFAALGLGLAFPFLLISAVPAFGRILPRPGPWMVRFRQLLAFPMYGTVIWLVWVLGQQGGMNAVAAVLGAILLVPFVIWAWRLGTGTRIAGRGLAAAALAGMAWLLVFADGQEAPATGGPGPGAGYEVYDPQALAAYRAEGTPVFVNFTAAWCITCLANERVALSTDAVNGYFDDNGVRYMKGDWTRRDPVITAALAEFGRNGVPLYLYYPSGGDPVVLPQLLTSGIVLDELKAADRQALAGLPE